MPSTGSPPPKDAIVVFQIDGMPVIMPVEELREADPEQVREGVARRRLVATGGTCPCGAYIPKPNREQRRQMARDARLGIAVWEVTVPHAADCPAVLGPLAPRKNPPR